MVFFERCVKSVSLIGDSVDRTAETQGKKMIDKRFPLMYNNSCVTDKRRIRIHIGKGQFGLWRNTQEAEEAPLLRV